MTVDPRAAALVADLPALSELTPVQARVVDARRAASWSVGAEPPAVASVRAAVVAGLPVSVVTPLGDGPLLTVLHCHGGGWVVGSPSTYDLVTRRLAAECSVVVVDVDYRLAPEHPFPAGLDDCWAVLAELASAGPVAVAGDSGGGALAAALTLLARDRGVPLVAQLLVYPSVSLARSWPSYRECAVGGGLLPADAAWFADCWAPAGVDRADPLVSPYSADSLVGLPPAVVAVAEGDPLRDGGLAYADRLRQDGVPVTTVVAEGQVHGYLQMPLVPGAADAVAAAHRAFRLLLE